MKKKTLKFTFLLLSFCLMVSFSQKVNKNAEKYEDIPDHKSGTTDFNVDVPLTTLNIGNNVTKIGKNAFRQNALTSVTIGNSVATIGHAAFFENALTSIIIPNSVTTIDDFAFATNSLTNVTIGTAVTSIGRSSFGVNALTNVVIPNNVITIGDFVFAANPLKTVTIGIGVKTIGANAFAGNSTLEKVIAQGTTPAAIKSFSFGNRSNTDLIVPEGTINTYLSAGWTGFKSVTEDGALGTDHFALNAKFVSILITDNWLSVKLPTETSTLEHYSIYNISGVSVLTARQDPVSIAHLPHGVYIAVLTLDSGVISKKFVK